MENLLLVEIVYSLKNIMSICVMISHHSTNLAELLCFSIMEEGWMHGSQNSLKMIIKARDNTSLI